MFPNFDLINYFGPALLVASFVLLVISIQSNKKDTSELSKAINHFKATSLLFGVLIIILYLSLPSTPSLKSFGYPEDISAIKKDTDILRLLQEYNKAIVRTTEVLQWFLFLFVWWFLTTLFGVAKAFKTVKKNAHTQ
jgi:Na+-driven multidrug efflux pump